MVESPDQSGRLRIFIHRGPVSVYRFPWTTQLLSTCPRNRGNTRLLDLMSEPIRLADIEARFPGHRQRSIQVLGVVQMLLESGVMGKGVQKSLEALIGHVDSDQQSSCH